MAKCNTVKLETAKQNLLLEQQTEVATESSR